MEPVKLEPAYVLRAFFLLASIAALSVNFISALRDRFLLYGSRQTAPSSTGHPQAPKAKKSLLDNAVSLQVPHSWFLHFYVISIASSAFWAFQIVTKGSAFEFLGWLSANATNHLSSSMTKQQVIVTWALMLLQGLRRLRECITLRRPSAATMPVPTWIVGMAFYAAVGISVWIEGIPTLTTSENFFQNIAIIEPSLKVFLALPIFILASGIQHDCHEYLASLEKYTLPDHLFFRIILCPHYTCECAIYLSLAIISAPDGQILNSTMLMALLFTAVNLGLTAETSKRWYTQKFSEESMKGRWRMVPYIY